MKDRTGFSDWCQQQITNYNMAPQMNLESYRILNNWITHQNCCCKTMKWYQVKYRYKSRTNQMKKKERHKYPTQDRRKKNWLNWDWENYIFHSKLTSTCFQTFISRSNSKWCWNINLTKPNSVRNSENPPKYSTFR